MALRLYGCEVRFVLSVFGFDISNGRESGRESCDTEWVIITISPNPVDSFWALFRQCTVRDWDMFLGLWLGYLFALRI